MKPSKIRYRGAIYKRADFTTFSGDPRLGHAIESFMRMTNFSHGRIGSAVKSLQREWERLAPQIQYIEDEGQRGVLMDIGVFLSSLMPEVVDPLFKKADDGFKQVLGLDRLS